MTQKSTRASVGARDGETGKVLTRLARTPDRPTAHDFAHTTATARAATVQKDECKACECQRARRSVNHSMSEYLNVQTHTKVIGPLMAGLKRDCHGTFHHISTKFLHSRVTYFWGGHNVLSMVTLSPTGSMARGIETNGWQGE